MTSLYIMLNQLNAIKKNKKGKSIIFHLIYLNLQEKSIINDDISPLSGQD